MGDLDKQLSDAYQQAKRSHPAPSRIRRRVLAQAQQQTSIKTWLSLSKEWGAIAAAACVLVCVIGIYKIASYKAPISGTNAEHLIVEIHSYDSQPNNTNTSYANKYTQYSKAFKHQLAVMQAHHTKTAQLVAKNGKWSFVDCGNNQITVSDELVSDLMLNKRIDADLQVGDQVELALNREGFILQVSRNAAAC